MKKYRVRVKPPFANSVLADVHGKVIPSKETDSHRVRRENVGNQLEALTGTKPEWNRRSYCYLAELDDEQVAAVKTWNMVRAVQEIK